MSDDNDYENDEFEDYDDDDFESEEELEIGDSRSNDTHKQFELQQQRLQTPLPPQLTVQRPLSSSPTRSPLTHGPAGGLKKQILDKSVLGITDAQRAIFEQRLIRWNKLMQKVKLTQQSQENLFELKPQTQYELFAAGVGPYRGLNNAVIQTDQNIDQEIQTEQILYGNMRCQVPDDLTISNEQKPVQKLNSVDFYSPQFSRFIRRTGKIVEQILGGNGSIKKPAFKEEISSQTSQNKELICGHIKLTLESLLGRRAVTAVYFSQYLQHSVVVCAYGFQNDQSQKNSVINQCCCLCVWDLSLPQSPQHVMQCEGIPTCCVFGPPVQTQEPFIVVAGIKEGGLNIWDIRESQEQHPQIKAGNRTLVCRCPSYSTEFNADLETVDELVACQIISETSKSNNFQIVTMTQSGTITSWGILVLPPSKNFLDLDPGTRIGSRIQATKLNTATPIKNDFYSCMFLKPDDSNIAICGCSDGTAVKIARYGKCKPPKQYYASQTQNAMCNMHKMQVTCLDVSPFIAKMFLKGYKSSFVTLHSFENSKPLLSWAYFSRGEVVGVQWSPCRPDQFFVLDSSGAFFCFYILEQENQFQLISTFESGHKITCMKTGPKGSTGMFLVAYSDGRVDVHKLCGNFWCENVEQLVEQVAAIKTSGRDLL